MDTPTIILLGVGDDSLFYNIKFYFHPYTGGFLLNLLNKKRSNVIKQFKNICCRMRNINRTNIIVFITGHGCESSDNIRFLTKDKMEIRDIRFLTANEETISIFELVNITFNLNLIIVCDICRSSRQITACRKKLEQKTKNKTIMACSTISENVSYKNIDGIGCFTSIIINLITSYLKHGRTISIADYFLNYKHVIAQEYKYTYNFDCVFYEI